MDTHGWDFSKCQELLSHCYKVKSYGVIVLYQLIVFPNAVNIRVTCNNTAQLDTITVAQQASKYLVFYKSVDKSLARPD